MNENLKFDVIIYDNIGMPFQGTTPVHTSLGGSEFELILLAESLAKINKKVLVLNNNEFPSFENGVMYYPNYFLKEKKFTCKNFLINRYSQLTNNNINFENIFIFLQDFYGPEHINYFKFIKHQYPLVQFIAVSNFLKNTLPQELNIQVIHNMIPDWVYEINIKKNVNKFIYASAAFKGLNETIELWKILKKQYAFKKADLYVCNPGYDQVDQNLLNKNNVHFLGNLSFNKVVEEIASSNSLLYVNKAPETFCIVAAIANAVKTKINVLSLNNLGALPEVLPTNKFLTQDTQVIVSNLLNHYNSLDPQENLYNYKTSFIFNKWKKLFNYD